MTRAEPRWGTLAAVLLAHGLLWLGLQAVLWRAPPAPERHPALQWIDLRRTAPPERPPAPPQSPAAPRPAAPAALAALAPPRPAEPSTSLVLLPPPVVAEPAASAASAPPTRLLDSPASREALRRLGAQPLLSERAAQAMGEDLRRQDTALAEGVKAAELGDCLKGEYAGAGMGLLSLPALAVAAARGRCAR